MFLLLCCSVNFRQRYIIEKERVVRTRRKIFIFEDWISFLNLGQNFRKEDFCAP